MYLKKFDFFGTQINFTVGSEEKFRTIAGAFGSIFFIAIFIGVFFSNFQQFFLLRKVKIYEQSTFNPDQTIFLTNQNISLAFGIRNHSLLNSSYFQFKIEQVSFYGNGTKIYRKFDPVPCDIKRWAALGDQFLTFYQNNKLNQFVCVPDDFKLQVVGQYGNQVYKYLRFSVNRCKETRCSSLQQFKKYIKAIDYLQVNLAYINSAAQYQNISKPLDKYPQKLYYRFVPLRQKLSIQQFFHKIQITTQKSVLPFQDLQVQSGIFFQRAALSTYLHNQNQQDPEFFKLMIKTMSFSKNVSRNVQTLDQFLSFVGGIFFVIDLIGKLIFQGYAKYKFHQVLFNKTYKFVNDSFYQMKADQKIRYLQEAEPFDFWYFQFFFWKVLGWSEIGKKIIRHLFGKQINLMEQIDLAIEQDRNILNLHEKLNFLAAATVMTLTGEQSTALKEIKWKLIRKQESGQSRVNIETEESSGGLLRAQMRIKDIIQQIIGERVSEQVFHGQGET